MRVIAVFWSYLRCRVPDSDSETEREMDREAGDKGDAIYLKRETRDSSGAPPIDVAALPRVPSPAQSAAVFFLHYPNTTPTLSQLWLNTIPKYFTYYQPKITNKIKIKKQLK